MSRRLVRNAERERITGVPTSTWYALQAQGRAPKPVKLSERAVAWIEDELFDFNEQRIANTREREAS